MIVPVYNGEKHLQECLNSLCAQSLTDIEILAVQNGSSDGSGKILNTMSARDKRIRVVDLADNIRVYGARNLALSKAAGKYIAFCDCDDTVPLEAYERMYDECERRCLDVLSADYAEMLYADERKKRILHCERRNGFYGYMLGGAVWNRLFRAEFLRKNKLCFPKSSHGEDTLFLAKVYACGAAAGTLKSVVYNYHVRKTGESSLAQEHRSDALKEYFQMEDAIRTAVKDVAPPDEWKRYEKRKLCYLRQRWWDITNLKEKEDCYPLIRDAALRVFESDPEFRRCMHVSREEMAPLTCGEYLTRLNVFDAAECALTQFEAGGIGFRYIIRYIRAWLKYKLERKT